MKKEEVGDLVNWIILNPQLAEKYYPNIVTGLKQRIWKSQPYKTALLIQRVPQLFPDWKSKADEFFGIRKEKIIKEYIELLSIILNDFDSSNEHEIIREAVESVRLELEEQLEFWKKELKYDEINNSIESKLTIDQIALKLYYEGETVTSENSDEIIKKFGLTSGKKLYQQASFFSKRANWKFRLILTPIPGILTPLLNGNMV